MYDKKYAKAWIIDYESGKDIYRSKFIMPYLKKNIAQFPEGAKILDVGCGWGITIPYLRNADKYVGIDITTDFFDYVKLRYPESPIKLKYGGLPSNLDFDENSFDLIICSMSLHTIKNLKLSIKNLINKLKNSGKLVLVDFNNDAEKLIRARFRGIIQKGYCKGMFTLSCGLEVESEVFFHREEDYERELKKYGNFVKTFLGPIFVGYVLTK